MDEKTVEDVLREMEEWANRGYLDGEQGITVHEWLEVLRPALGKSEAPE